MIRKELEEYWRAENALRDKVCKCFDGLNKEIDVYLRQDNHDYELHFVRIKDKLIEEDNGSLWDYRSFTIGELLDLWDSLEQDIKEG